MRNFKIPTSQTVFIQNLSEMIDNKMETKNYLISEQDIADKYKVEVEEVIALVKQAIPLENDILNSKLRRNKILDNLYTKGLDYYKENDKQLNSDFTDAIIVKNGKILFGLRSKDSLIEPNKWGLLGAGHLEKWLSPQNNVLKEIKEETNLDIIETKLVDVRKLPNGMKIYYFYCTPAQEGEVTINNEEHSNYKWMSLKDIEKMDDSEFMFDLKDYLLTLLGSKN